MARIGLLDWVGLRGNLPIHDGFLGISSWDRESTDQTLRDLRLCASLFAAFFRVLDPAHFDLFSPSE